MEEQYAQPYPVPMGGGGHSAEGSIKFQLLFDDIISDIEHNLRCQTHRFNEHGAIEWVQAEHSYPLINEMGMVRLRTILRSQLNRNAPLSDLADEEIRGICRDIEFNIRNLLNDNWGQFEIPDTSAATTIRQTIGNAVFINMKKSGDGRFLRHLRSTHHSSEISQVNNQGQVTPAPRKSVMQKLLGR